MSADTRTVSPITRSRGFFIELCQKYDISCADQIQMDSYLCAAALGEPPAAEPTLNPVFADILKAHNITPRTDSERLGEAAMLLRMVVSRKSELFCLRDKIADWLTRNNLNGSVLR